MKNNKKIISIILIVCILFTSVIVSEYDKVDAATLALAGGAMAALSALGVIGAGVLAVAVVGSVVYGTYKIGREVYGHLQSNQMARTSSIAKAVPVSTRMSPDPFRFNNNNNIDIEKLIERAHEQIKNYLISKALDGISSAIRDNLDEEYHVTW